MLDDWAYREHIEAPQRRQRAKSIVQSVASHKSSDSDWSVIGAELRPRANSVPTVVHLKLDGSTLDTPLTARQKKELNDWTRWVGPESIIDDFDAMVFDGQIENYRKVFERAELATKIYQGLSAETEDLLSKLDLTKASLESITSEIVEMRIASDSGLHEQEKLNQLHQDLEQNLKIFDNLESATKALNKPGTKLVGRIEEFTNLLHGLDDGLAYCKEHPKFKDMDLYELRHTQCIARAVSLAQDFCTAHLRKVTGSILTKLTSSTLASPSAMHALIWTKFEADAEFIYPIVSLLRAREEANLKASFDETLKQYFTCRSQLVSQELARALAPLAPPGPTDFVAGVQNILVQFVGIFEKEEKIYSTVIGPPGEQFKEWLGDICQPLYDHLRRYIIRESDITRLCQILVALQSHANQVFEPIHRDTQNRLMFRADLMVDNISKYRPTSKDWNKDVYPTVSEALDLLGQVYQLLNNEVFNNLAHRCVHQCVISLETARESAVSRLGALEGGLFQIKQLVFLQSRIMDFNVEHSLEHDVDFSGLQSFVEAFWQNRSQFNSFREVLGMAWTSVPHVVEHMIDAMEGLYSVLRSAVAKFTETALQIMVDPIARNDPRTVPDDVHKFRETVAVELKRINGVVHDYISEPKICDVLLDSLQDALIKRYGEYYHLVYNAGSPDVLEGVMDSDAMVAWLGELARALHEV